MKISWDMMTELFPTAVKPQQCLYHFSLLSVMFKINWNKNGAAA
jgi:hypothetical protein